MDISILDSRNLKEPPKWSELFSKIQPIVVEIGCGKGTFLSQVAKRDSQFNFIGIERLTSRTEKIKKKSEYLAIENVLLVCGWAEDVIPNWFLKEPIHKILIQCPDPWPKRKHHRRRLIQNQFIQGMYNCLVPEGIVHLNTDHPGYAQWMLEHMEQSNLFINLTGKGKWSLKTDEEVETIHHKKFKAEGRTIHYMTFQKKPKA